MHHRWRTDDEARYTEQIRTLKESLVVLTEKNGKLEEELAAEKTVSKDHQKNIVTNERIHTLEVTNLNDRLNALEKDKAAYQNAFLPRMSSMGLSRRGEMASMNHVSPEFPRDENGPTGRKALGSCDSPYVEPTGPV